MLNEDLKLKLTGIQPLVLFEEGGEWLNISCSPGRIKSICTATPVRSGPHNGLSVLPDLCGLENTFYDGLSFFFNPVQT